MPSVISGVSLLVLILLSGLCMAASSDEWRGRSIYQVITDRFALTNGSTTKNCDAASSLYCGGTWQGIIKKLDYIQGMGFDAVWISPITSQVAGNSLDGTSYHGYWQQDIYKLNSAFGTPEDLRALAAELHARKMYLMVDIVTNHYAYNGPPSEVKYERFHPFNDTAYFHRYCPIDFDDVKNLTNSEKCWEGSTNMALPDLRTEDVIVQAKFANWIKELVANYTIDGLRIDSVLEVNTGFWPSFLEAAGVYAVGEVNFGDPETVASYQDYMPGVLNYGTYFPLIRAFQRPSSSFNELVGMIGAVQKASRDPTLLGTFSENHDVPRFGSLSNDTTLAKNVLAFTLLTDGIPIVYQGQEQHYAGLGGGSVPFNREALWSSGYNTRAELYNFVRAANAIRRHAIASDPRHLRTLSSVLHSDNSTLVMLRGKMLVVYSNTGAMGGSYKKEIHIPGNATSGCYTDIVTCETIDLSLNGTLPVSVVAGAPRIYYPSANLAGSVLCASGSNITVPTRARRIRRTKF